MINVQDALRAQHTKRWTLVNTAKDQSIAEHMFNVAMIARHICAKAGIHGDEQNQITMAALLHDIDEVVTGDIPAPTKGRIRHQLGKDVNDLEVTVDLHHKGNNNGSVIETIIKYADYIESIWFIDENGIGRHAGRVGRDLVDAFWAYREQLPSELLWIDDAAMRVQDELKTGSFMI